MKKRKIDKLILVAIISACFSFLALNLARFGFRNYDEHIVNYKEDSKIDYKVYLKPNDFFAEEFLPQGMSYVTSLIDFLRLDFNYNLDLDKEVSGNYSYYIKGTVTANRENSDSKFYAKDYILKDVKTESYTDKKNINIKDSIDVDYDIYNNVLTSFRDEYGVQMDGNLKVSLIVENNVKDSVSGESTSLKNETDIDIPLTTLTVEVPIESNDKTDSGVLLSSKIEKEGMIYIIGRVLAVICYATSFISLLYFIYLTYLGFKLENAYVKKLKKILKVYDGIIVNVKKKPKMDNTKVIWVSSFEELIDAHGEVRNPINYVSLRDGALFLLVSESYIYAYKLERELFSSGEVVNA